MGHGPQARGRMGPGEDGKARAGAVVGHCLGHGALHHPYGPWASGNRACTYQCMEALGHGHAWQWGGWCSGGTLPPLRDLPPHNAHPFN